MSAQWVVMKREDLRAQIDRELIDEADPLDPDNIPGAIMVATNGDILDGFHRAAGVIRATAPGTLITVLQVLDEDLAARIAEPGPRQQ
jgi:hypothetical protein